MTTKPILSVSLPALSMVAAWMFLTPSAAAEEAAPASPQVPAHAARPSGPPAPPFAAESVRRAPPPSDAVRDGQAIRTLDDLPDRARTAVLATPLAGDGEEIPAAARSALERFTRQTERNRNAIRTPEQWIQRLEEFADEPDAAALAPALKAQLGDQYFSAGYFTKALDAWGASWAALKDSSTEGARETADHALAQYARMLARVGRYEDLGPLLESVGDRPITGAASEILAGAREGYWSMIHEPGVSFLCGPLALANIYLDKFGPSPEDDEEESWERWEGGLEVLQAARSTRQGFNLEQLQELADAANIDYQVVRRDPGAPMPHNLFPMLVHWSLDHYGALFPGEDGRTYLLKDPTFLTNVRVTREALEEESSGYFMVPAGPLPRGWHAVDAAEARTIWGRGNPSGKDDSGSDDSNRCPDEGMAVYSFQPMLVSLRLRDIPLAYNLPYGGRMSFLLTYNQRDATLPANFSFTNFGPKWSFEWISFIEDNPLNAEGPVIQYASGVRENFDDFDDQTGFFGYTTETRLRLQRVSDSPVRYELHYPDGAVDVYEHSDGAVGAGRRVFLSERRDPRGNAFTFGYDLQMRLLSITDPIGQVSVLRYENPAFPLKVTGIEDPFGRQAKFRYDSQGRLAEIEDVIGIVSAFEYNSADFIRALVTPYGRTEFSYGEEGPRRWLQIKDPYGDIERVEFRNHDVANDDRDYPIPDSAPVTPTNFSSPNISNSYLSERNTFHWTKNAWSQAPGDYEAARITHWLHKDVMHGVISHIPESRKNPLERREWYTYPNQTNSRVANPGMIARPKQIGRVLDSGANQTYRFTYNDLGNVIEEIDPVSRKFAYIYDSNGIDLLEVRQRFGSNDELVVAYSDYNSQHLPETMTDAAGQTTTYEYTATGQLARVVNPLGEETVYTYDMNLDGNPNSEGGYLIRVERTDPDNPSGLVTVSEMTYHANGTLATTADSDGYTLSYQYDAMDRMVRIDYPDGTHEAFEYTLLDRSVHRDREGKRTWFFHDKLRRLTIKQDYLMRMTQYEYCSCNGLRRLTDANQNVTRWFRDVQGRVERKEYADGQGTDFVYFEALSWLKERTDALGQVTEYTYTNDGNLRTINYSNTVHPTPGVEFFYAQTYNRLTRMEDGTGNTQFSYHPVDGQTPGAGQLSEVNPPVNNGIIRYTYDALGRTVERSVEHIPQSWQFDSLGRVTQETNQLGTFTYDYDGLTNRVSSVALPNGQTTAYNYFDDQGDHRLQEIEHLDSQANLLSRFEYEYSPVGNITRWEKELGTVRHHDLHLRYDRADQLIHALAQEPGTTTVIQDFGYAYDKAGNRITERIDALTRSGGFNELNQLTDLEGGGTLHFIGHTDKPAHVTVNGKDAVLMEGGTRFEVELDLPEGTQVVTVRAEDVNENVTEQDYEVEVEADDPQSFVYDANGNLLDDGDRQYAWDAENRLISITEGDWEVQFTYDGMDRRLRRVETDDSVETRNNWYIWDGLEIVQERNNTGGAWRKRYFGQGVEIRDGSNSDNYYYTRDHLGSIREVVADDGETVVARYDYDPYGRVEVLGTETIAADFRYTGHFYYNFPGADPAKGLHLAPYRAYSADHGRWLSRDPLQDAEMLPEGPGLYGYVGNNPIIWIDPLGESGLPFGASQHGDLPPEVLQELYGIEPEEWDEMVEERCEMLEAAENAYRDALFNRPRAIMRRVFSPLPIKSCAKSARLQTTVG